MLKIGLNKADQKTVPTSLITREATDLIGASEKQLQDAVLAQKIFTGIKESSRIKTFGPYSVDSIGALEQTIQDYLQKSKGYLQKDTLKCLNLSNREVMFEIPLEMEITKFENAQTYTPDIEPSWEDIEDEDNYSKPRVVKKVVEKSPRSNVIDQEILRHKDVRKLIVLCRYLERIQRHILLENIGVGIYLTLLKLEIPLSDTEKLALPTRRVSVRIHLGRIKYSTLESSYHNRMGSDALCSAQKARRLEYVGRILGLVRSPPTHGNSFSAPIDASCINSFIEPCNTHWTEGTINSTSMAQIEGALLGLGSNISQDSIEKAVDKILAFLPTPRIHYLYLDEFAKICSSLLRFKNNEDIGSFYIPRKNTGTN